jgi:two-component system sensor histidine kinase DegS
VVHGAADTEDREGGAAGTGSAHRSRGSAAGTDAVATRVAAELAKLKEELDEIAMLVGQAREETERHGGRRQKGEERVRALETDARPDLDELRQANAQLLALTRRQLLFDAQKEVLEGKQKTLFRYRDALARILAELGDPDPEAVAALARQAASQSAAAAAAVAQAAADARRDRAPADSAAVLRAQEDLRRDIARQMHDGPAQSLANIALQSEIVERLVARGDQRAQAELEALRKMVQSTLTATKEFIFDVRPMVLDDLGLVPTLRRTAIDRGHRAGLEIDFDSSGTDRRLGPDLESGLFRILDDVISGYLALRPARVTVRLDWSARELSATIRGHWTTSGSAPKRRSEPPSKDMPPALAAMIEEKDREDRQAIVDARSLPNARLQELLDRAAILDVTLTVLDDGQATEIVAPLA